MARRLADGWTLADATPQVVDHLSDSRDPWPEATGLDSTETIDRTARRAVAAIEAFCGAPTAPRVVPPQMDFWGGWIRRTESGN